MSFPSLRQSWRCMAAVSILATSPGAFAASAPVATEQPPGESASDYVIGPGDTLDVFVWRQDELSAQVPVRPDGRISTPLVEDMMAVGKTPSQLARDMEKVLSEFIRSPKVNILVTEAVSANSQVRVVGQAVTPRAIPYRKGLTVLDAITEVGGLSEFAAGNRAKLVRQGPNGKTTEKRVRLRDLLDKGDLSQNLPLQPGDVLVVPETRF